MLGIKYFCKDTRQTVANEEAWNKALRRCQRIGVAISKDRRKKHFIRTMVLPKALWNAAWQRPPIKQIDKLRTAIEACVRNRRDGKVGTRSKYLAWSVSIGAEVCPYFYAACTSLRIEQHIIGTNGGVISLRNNAFQSMPL